MVENHSRMKTFLPFPIPAIHPNRLLQNQLLDTWESDSHPYHARTLLNAVRKRLDWTATTADAIGIRRLINKLNRGWKLLWGQFGVTKFGKMVADVPNSHEESIILMIHTSSARFVGLESKKGHDTTLGIERLLRNDHNMHQMQTKQVQIRPNTAKHQFENRSIYENPTFLWSRK